MAPSNTTTICQRLSCRRRSRDVSILETVAEETHKRPALGVSKVVHVEASLPFATGWLKMRRPVSYTFTFATGWLKMKRPFAYTFTAKLPSAYEKRCCGRSILVHSFFAQC